MCGCRPLGGQGGIVYLHVQKKKVRANAWQPCMEPLFPTRRAPRGWETASRAGRGHVFGITQNTLWPRTDHSATNFGYGSVYSEHACWFHISTSHLHNLTVYMFISHPPPLFHSSSYHFLSLYCCVDQAQKKNTGICNKRVERLFVATSLFKFFAQVYIYQ